MATKKQTKKSQVKKILKRELVSNRKYKTTYKDIKKYFKMINKAVFDDKLSPFNDILIKKIYKDETKKYFKIINEAVFDNLLSPFNEIKIKKIYKDYTKKFCYGQVTVWEWKRKGTRQYWLEMLPTYRNKKDFVDTLGHEMVHLYQMANKGDTGNHNKLFYSFRPKLNAIGLDL